MQTVTAYGKHVLVMAKSAIRHDLHRNICCAIASSAALKTGEDLDVQCVSIPCRYCDLEITDTLAT